MAEAVEEALAVGLREVAEGSLAALDQAHRLAAALVRARVHPLVEALALAQVHHSALAAERGQVRALELVVTQDLQPELAPVQGVDRQDQPD